MDTPWIRVEIHGDDGHHVRGRVMKLGREPCHGTTWRQASVDQARQIDSQITGDLVLIAADTLGTGLY